MLKVLVLSLTLLLGGVVAAEPVHSVLNSLVPEAAIEDGGEVPFPWSRIDFPWHNLAGFWQSKDGKRFFEFSKIKQRRDESYTLNIREYSAPHGGALVAKGVGVGWSDRLNGVLEAEDEKYYLRAEAYSEARPEGPEAVLKIYISYARDRATEVGQLELRRCPAAASRSVNK